MHDTTQFTTSLDIGPDITPRAGVTDKGYDSIKNRTACRERGIVAVIPYRANTKTGRNPSRSCSTEGAPALSRPSVS